MFNLVDIDSSWHPILKQALKSMDPVYLKSLTTNSHWLPGQKNIFNAFKLPLSNTRYILFGESPYPRPTSANGYAFWDAAVTSIWSDTGMTKPVNKATSLRNFLKMLMICKQSLSEDDTSQAAIAALDKSRWIQDLNALFNNMLSEGFLLLNASLVLSDRPVPQESRYWEPFIISILKELSLQNTSIQLILFGKIAEKLQKFEATKAFKCLTAEHPYNISFIKHPAVQNFFKPFNLLENRDKLHFSE